MNNARPLHQFYKSEHVHVPTIKELILDKIRFESYFYDIQKSKISDETMQDEIHELQELCKMIDLDFAKLPHYDDSDGWKELGWKTGGCGVW